MRLQDLNALPDDEAAAAFLRCCGSTRWARMMAAARPFAGVDALAAAAETAAGSLDRPDWLEAFAAHPQIGESTRSSWAAGEQVGSRSASDEVRRRLAEGNTAYHERFGYIFIVCATGKSAAEMLRLLEGRLTNDAATECRVAAGEQRKITRLRLAKLLD
jgi:2-oxo-4-hydroxy-4-carboxy-5-ureidoimidazoline decarboxylase